MEQWGRKCSKVKRIWKESVNAGKHASNLFPHFEMFRIEWRTATGQGQRIPIYMECEKGHMYWKSVGFFIFILYGIVFTTLSQLLGLNGTGGILNRVLTGIVLSGTLFSSAVVFYICKNGDTLALGVNGMLHYQFTLRSGN